MTVPPFLWVRIMNDADLKAENGRLRERIDALEQQLRDATTSSADWDAELQRENARLMAENATLARMGDEVMRELEQCRQSLALKSAWERAK